MQSSMLASNTHISVCLLHSACSFTQCCEVLQCISGQGLPDLDLQITLLSIFALQNMQILLIFARHCS